MPPQPARRHRPVVTLLLGGLLAVLTLGLVCGAGSAGASGVPARAAAPVAAYGEGTYDEAAHDAFVQRSDGGVGCGQKKDDQGSQPVAPTRGTAHEQLVSTLSYEHAAPGALTADGVLPGVTPHRGPPPRDPPTPVELSVLRV